MSKLATKPEADPKAEPERRTPATVLAVLRQANERGEIGYGGPPGGDGWSALLEAERRGLVRYLGIRNREVIGDTMADWLGRDEKWDRRLYELTRAGRAEVEAAKQQRKEQQDGG